MKTPLVSLARLLRLVRRKIVVDPNGQYPEVGVYCFGKGLFHKTPRSGVEVGDKPLFEIRDRDFILQVTFAWEGAVAVASQADESFFGSIRVLTFQVDEANCLPEYLRYYFRTPEGLEQLGRISPGSAGRNRVLNAKRIPEVMIPLPPLLEQRRIVAKIEQLAAKIEEARGLRKQGEEELEAMLASASDAAFTPQPGWIASFVGDFCEPPQYGFTASAISDPIGPRLLRITDIQEGRVNWDNVPYCQCSNPDQYRLRAKDIVFARTGATTGKSFLIRNCPEAVFASYLIRLRVKRLVTVEYLYCYFQTPSYWSQITDEKKGTGQPNVNGTKLMKLRVPIAPPEEQRRIVAYLDSLQAQVDRLNDLQAQTAAELEALLPSILDKAFKGEL